MSAYEVYTKLLNEKGVRTADVCRATGLSTSTMSQWKKGMINLRMENLDKLADYFGVSVYAFYEENDEIAPATLDFDTVKIKVLGTVPAGVPIDAVEDIIGEEVISMKDAQTGDFFGLRIKGDSMVPDILPGSIVIVRQQEDVENGDIAIVMINGSEATCKKIEKYDRGIMLVPSNGAYEPQFYSFEDMERMPVRILGKVTEIRRKL